MSDVRKRNHLESCKLSKRKKKKCTRSVTCGRDDEINDDHPCFRRGPHGAGWLGSLATAMYDRLTATEVVGRRRKRYYRQSTRAVRPAATATDDCTRNLIDTPAYIIITFRRPPFLLSGIRNCFPDSISRLKPSPVSTPLTH